MNYGFAKSEFELVFRNHLESKGMTQAYLAKQLHIHRATLSKWIMGINKISFANIQKVGQILQLSDEEINHFFQLAGYSNYLFESSEKAERASYDAILCQNISDLRMPHVLVDRREHVEILLAKLRKHTHVLLSGYAGVGKTTIASIICRQFLQEQKKPILWVGAHSSDVKKLFDSLLTPLNKRAKIMNKEGRAASQVIRKELVKANLSLIVIDSLNVLTGLAELRFVFPPDIPVLITSWKRASNIDYCHHISSMGMDQGIELLSKYAQNGSFSRQEYSRLPETHQLCNQLDYHPFCLTAAGTWLKERQAHPSVLLERLDLNLPAPTKIPIPEDHMVTDWKNVHALLNNSFLELAPLARQILHVFGSFEVPFGCFPTQRGIIKFSHNNRLFAQNVDFSAVND